jgi:ABC-2 type transport system permease protein
MYALFKKEISNFLSSLIGIMVIVVFLLITGLFLWVFQSDFNLLTYGYANLDGLFILAPWVFLFLVPAVTMRSFAEENRTGTIEMLTTKPLSEWQIIWAKFLASVVLVLLALIPTAVYYFSVYRLGFPMGNLDTGGILGSYIGLFLLSASFVSIGIFCSSVTNNQILAFILSVFLCGFMYIGFELIYSLSLFGRIDLFIQRLGMAAHYSSISRGVVDTRDVLYFLSVMAIFLCMTKLVLASRKWVTSFVVTLVIIAALNTIGSFMFTRFDLTAEKRYTLTETTKKTLHDLDDYVYFKVYLEGDFPAGFKKLRRETKEMLDEFRAYTKFIDYEFINPSESADRNEINETYKTLYQQGLNPTNLTVQNSDGSSRQMVIWPGALVSYRNDTEIAVDLLENQMGQSSEEALNASMQNLEYKLLDAIVKVTRAKKPSIGFIEGHGELTENEVYDITQTLKQNYHVTRGEIAGKVDALMERYENSNGEVKANIKFDALVIAKPTQPFDEKDKFLLDQYIMHGGKVLWLVEPVFATMDSLTDQESTIGVDQDLNLDDMLFRYGVRLNRNLLLDMNCAALPIRTGQVAGQAQLEFYRWFYFPLAQAASNHPMVRHLNAVKMDFVSSIDPTTSEGDIVKTPLLKTSDYTKVSGVPVFITLAMLRQSPDKRMFPSRGQNVAYLLKGTFPSLYANRLTAEIEESKEMHFLAESVPTSMIVVADGDVIRNQIDVLSKKPLPLGYDQYTQNTYGNKDFIENAISYLVDGENLISIRSREFKIRLLDPDKKVRQRLRWQLVNTLVPVGTVILFGLIMAFVRKKKYSSSK